MSTTVPADWPGTAICVVLSILTKLLVVTSSRSNDAKTNVRSRLSGPPNVAPNCFWRYGALGRLISEPAGVKRSKYDCEFNASCRKNEKTLPVGTLVPLLVTILTTPPDAFPYSAVYELVMTWNSRTAS